MRSLFEAMILALCSLIFALPGPSESKADHVCIDKTSMEAKISKDMPKIFTTDLNGKYENLFLANLSRIVGEDMTGYDVVFYRAPGKSTTLLMFYKDNCAAFQTEVPNEAVIKMLNMA